MNFGKHILGGVGPLVEAVEGTDPPPGEGGTGGAPGRINTANAVDADLRKSPRGVGIIYEILFHPTSGINAHLIDQAGAERVVPEQGFRAVQVGGVEQVHETVAVLIDALAGVRDVVDAKGDQVFAGDIEVQTTVVLLMAAVAGFQSAPVESNVRGGPQVVGAS